MIDRCVKLYPWEDMMREPFAAFLPRSGTEWVAPAWKAVLSNKGLLPHLWERHRGHPNLLPAFFEGDPRASELEDHVRKPFYSREGENVAIVEAGKTARRARAFTARAPRRAGTDPALSIEGRRE